MKRQLRRVSLWGAFVIGVVLLLPTRVGTIGGQFGLEFAIDAPWRLEPQPTRAGGYTYGPIPIVVAFHDAVYETERSAEIGCTAIFTITRR